MAEGIEEHDKVEATASEPQGTQAEPEPKASSTDWKAEARKWEARAKENKAKADKWDEREDAEKSELELMTERAQEAERMVAEFKHAAEVRQWALEASAATNVPASVLRGDSLDEMMAHAKEILSSGLSAYGKVPDGGERGGSPVTRDSILQIKDQRKRINAIAEHPELF